MLQSSNGSARPLAGGQSLIPLMNLGLAKPGLIVDLAHVAELRRVEEERDYLFIGATVTHAQIEDGELPDATLGMLQYVAGCIASRGVRNRGTIGGNLVHADPAADWPAALMALGADAQVVGTTGQRSVPIFEFVREAFTTALRSGELLEGVRIPRLSRSARWSYYRVRRAANASPDAIGVVVIDRERGFCRTVLSGGRQKPRDLPEIANRLANPDGGDFATKEDLERATEVVTRNGFGDDAVEAQIYATALSRAVKRALDQ
jgi:carbon-monoxide dehydrogenase medium subunit